MPAAVNTDHSLRNGDKGGRVSENSKKQTSGKKVDAIDCANHWENMVEDGTRRYKEFKERERKNSGQSNKENEDSNDVEGMDVSTSDEEDVRGDTGESTAKYEKGRRGHKREHSREQPSSSKKQKESDGNGKQDGAPAPQGSKSRLPKKGDQVHWKALPGFVEGEVVDVVYEEKTVQGKAVKGKSDDPRIVLKSSSSGKIAVHKPEAVYFE